jgi:hypothetical protein
MGIRKINRRINRWLTLATIKEMTAGDLARDKVIGSWNELDGANLSTSDMVPTDIFLGHPDAKWSKTYGRMVKDFGRDEAREIAQDEFPQRQLNRIRLLEEF